MCGYRLPVLGLLLSSVVCAKEPPLRIEVDLGGTRQVVEVGSATDIAVDGKSHRIVLRTLPFRRFDNGTIRFEYPVSMGYEESIDPSMWTLDGNDAVLIVTQLEPDDDTTPADALNGFAQSLGWSTGAPAAPVSLRTTHLGALTGMQQVFSTQTLRSHQERHVLVVRKSRYLLALQDSLDDNGNHSAEFKILRQRLIDTLESTSQ